MNLRQLDALRSVLSQGSFTRAAETMGITQPAVTRLIADLEAAVGFRLFERGPGGVRATPEALLLGEELERTVLGMARLAQAARDIRDNPRGHVRIASMPAVAAMMAPTAIARFVEDNPGIKVTLDGHTSPRVIDLTAAGEFHLGFAHCPERRADIEVLARYRMDCVAVLPSGHTLADRSVIRPDDLDGVEMVALSHHTVTAGHVDHVFAQAGVAPRIVAECQPSYVACGLVARGVGISIVDPLTPDLFGPGAIVVRPFEPAIPFDFAIVRPADGALPRAAGAFAEMATTVLDAQAGLRRQPAE